MVKWEGRKREGRVSRHTKMACVRGSLFGACGSGSAFAVSGFGLVLAFQISYLKAGFKVSGSKRSVGSLGRMETSDSGRGTPNDTEPDYY